MKLLLTLVLIFCTTWVYPLDFYCTSDGVRRLVDSGDSNAAALKSTNSVVPASTRITIQALRRAYQGRPILLDSGYWVRVYMAPPEDALTQQAFSFLGLTSADAQAAWAMAEPGLVDVAIVRVRDYHEMERKIANSLQPAIGYTHFFSGGRNVKVCF